MKGGLEEAATLPTTTVATTARNPYSIRTVHCTLAFVQLGYAGYQILTRVALVSGIDQFAFSIYRNTLAFLLLGPVAYHFERNVRPKMTLSIFCGLNILSLTAIVGCQQLFLVGLSLTTPMFAAVAQNLIPVFTFLLAVMSGTEEVDIRRRDGIAKVIGTVICISGAVIMSVYKGTAIYEGGAVEPEVTFTRPFLHLGAYLHPHLVHFKVDNYALGGLTLVANTMSWAVYLNVQAPVLRAYPALLSMSSFTYMFGAIQLGIVGFIFEGTVLFSKFSLTSTNQIVSVLYTGIIASSINLVLQSWCVQKAGAFIVSLYMPFQMLMVACMSILLLGDALYLGTLLGAILIVGGFYVVVYGKSVERRRKRAAITAPILEKINVGNITEDADLKQPLLPSK